MRRHYLMLLLANSTRSPTHATPVGPADKPYDHRGALWYVATVVTVYAMAILFMIVSHINRRAGKRELDQEVSAFLRSAPTVRIEEERQHRRNLKRAMQPFIRLALDRRTVGLYVTVADGPTGDLVTHPSIETLNSISQAREPLPVSDRVLQSSRCRSRSSHSLISPPSCLFVRQHPPRPASRASAESGDRWQVASAEDVVVLGGGLNDKAIQCGLDPKQRLANRARPRLRSVPSEAELGASASSQKMAMLLQQQRRPPAASAMPSTSSIPQQQLRLELGDSFEDREASASRTHVPRFLAAGAALRGPAPDRDTTRQHPERNY